MESELSEEETIAGIADVLDWGQTYGQQIDMRASPETFRFNKDAKDGPAATRSSDGIFRTKHLITFHGADNITKTNHDHEVAHILARELDDGLVPRTKDANPPGWDDVIAKADAEGINSPTGYGEEGPAPKEGDSAERTLEKQRQEDFAESIAAYINARDHGPKALAEFKKEYPYRSKFIEDTIFTAPAEEPGPPPRTTVPDPDVEDASPPPTTIPESGPPPGTIPG